MGLEVERFVTDIEDSWKCPLCRRVYDNPLRTPCGCVFCAGCVLPSVIQKGRCPRRECSQNIIPNDLVNVLDLHNNIVNLQVRCDNVGKGCTQVTTLAALPGHLRKCDHRSVQCHNRGCTETMSLVHQAKHEGEVCRFRPVGICQSGCNLVLQHWDSNNHDCIRSLRSHISEQEMRLNTLNAEVKKTASTYNEREKGLLNQISNLHSLIQTQTGRFRKKIVEYKNHMAMLAKYAAKEQVKLYSVLILILQAKSHQSRISPTTVQVVRV